MKKFLIATASVAALSFGAPALALAANSDFPTVDTNRDGGVSYTELLVIAPDLGESEYRNADVNGDGILTEDEFGKFAAVSSEEGYDVNPTPDSQS